jgi:uncharacterized membrane protein
MRLGAIALPTMLALVSSTLAATTSIAEAHPGALDANGCHRVRRTGQQVCHAGHARSGEHRRYIGFDGVVRHFSH